MGGLAPILGQAHHFPHSNPGKSLYAERVYGTQATLLDSVIDRAFKVRVISQGQVATPTLLPIWLSGLETLALSGNTLISTLSTGLSMVCAYRRSAGHPNQLSGPEKHA
tara:strand:- start:430 stop:756 length:327 start_codon:yes stop_codon:yes gene_type:complete